MKTFVEYIVRSEKMQSKSVMLLESNSAVMEQLCNEFNKSLDFKLVYVSDDGEDAISKIEKFHPDLIVTSMFLRGADGCAIIQQTRRVHPYAKIVAVGNATDGLVEKAFALGVDYYLVKPFSVKEAIVHMRELFEEEEVEVKEYSPFRRRPVSLNEKISDIFISIGIPPHIKGYAYLREGIRLTVENPFIINSVTKELYPRIAYAFSTSASKVERAIRHAIEVAWNRGRIDAINAVFGTRVYLGVEKPTNSEFIALVADKLILENMM